MCAPTSYKHSGRCACGRKERWRDGTLAIVFQIFTFFGLCYLLVVFHYELVRSKANEKALATQVSQLTELYTNAGQLEKGKTNGNDTKVMLETDKKHKWTKKRSKRKKRQSNEPVTLHVVAHQIQKLVSDGYILINPSCEQICRRLDSHFRFPQGKINYFIINYTGTYFIYSQMEYIGGINMYHTIEAELGDQTMELFKGGGKHNRNTTKYIGGIVKITENTKIKVKVNFEDNKARTMLFSETQTYIGLYKIET